MLLLLLKCCCSELASEEEEEEEEELELVTDLADDDSDGGTLFRFNRLMTSEIPLLCSFFIMRFAVEFDELVDVDADAAPLLCKDFLI